MKFNLSFPAAILGLAAMAPPAEAQFPAVAFHETAAEFSGRADLDGNGLPEVILVDKTSGSIRICWQTAAGIFQWDEPRASGIGEVTGVTAGHFLTVTQDTLAVTAPEANRINLLSPVPGAGLVPQSVFITPVGPTSLVAANLAGTIAVDDLWIGSLLNSSPVPGRFDQFANNPAGSFTLNANRHLSSGQLDSANAVVAKTGLGGTFAYLEHLPAGETLRVISAGEAGAPVRITLTGLPLDSAYLIAPFAGAAMANLLTWKSGDMGFSCRALSEPVVGTFALSAPVLIPVSLPIGQLILVPMTAVTSKLLVIAPGGTQAAYYDFNGSILSAPVETLTAAPGEAFTGGVALPGYGGFHLLIGSSGDGRSSTSRYMKWNAASGRFVDNGRTLFGAMGKRSGAGNVMVFAGEPFVSPTSKLLARLNARDWSSGAVPVPPAALNLTGETNRSSLQGLGGPAAVNLGAPPAGATHVILNQYLPWLSFFGLSRAEGATIGEPFITPPGGTFSRTIPISFTVPPGMSVQFRDSCGIWLPWSIAGQQPDTNPGDPAYESWWASFRPLLRYQDTTIEYYGQAGSRRTAIKTAVFKFTKSPDKLSSLGDGVPDYVKLGLHFNPLLPPPNLDATLERGNFLTRLLPGVQNQRVLAANALDFVVRPVSLNGFDHLPHFSLMGNTPLPDGSLSISNQVSAYDGGGAFLDSSDGTGPWAAIGEQSAKLSKLSGDGNGGFTVLSTRPNFAIEGSFPFLPPPPVQPAPPLPQLPLLPPYPSAIGRELIGVVALPVQNTPIYQRTLGTNPEAAEAASWVAGATAYYNAASLPEVVRDLDSLDTMATLIFERWILLLCLERGFLPGEFTPPFPNAAAPPAPNPNYVSLTAFRIAEAAHPIGPVPAGAVYPTAAQLHALEVTPPPASSFRLRDVIAAIQNSLRNSADPDIANLRTVTGDVYTISSRWANVVRGGFPLPVDALRQFLATGAVPPAYGNKVLTPVDGGPPLPEAPYSLLTDVRFTSAREGMDKVLASFSPRPWSNFDLIVRPDTVQFSCTLLDKAVGPGTVDLVGFDGTPFKFPGSFSITAGTRLQVAAYTGLPDGPCGPAVEVIEIGGVPATAITSIPVPTPVSGSNLLPDDWELFFFGQTGLDPFSSPPGTDLSLLQLYLDGKDPLNAASYVGILPKLTKLPVPVITPMNGGSNFLINLDLPAAYADSFVFQLQTSSDLDQTGFAPAPEAFVQTQPGHFEVTTPVQTGPRGFWRVGISLK